MTGADDIVQMRTAGRAPAIVFVNDYPCKTHWAEFGEYATVCTAGDPISSLDLRFLVGLRVSISSSNEGRAKALFAKAKWFGAKTVAACHVLDSVKPWDQAGWAEVHHG